MKLENLLALDQDFFIFILKMLNLEINLLIFSLVPLDFANRFYQTFLNDGLYK